METTDVCDLDEFRNDPSCKKNQTIKEDIFWAFVLITISFFTRVWYMIVDRLLTKIFGVQKDDYELAIMGILSLATILILSQYFQVNLKT